MNKLEEKVTDFLNSKAREDQNYSWPNKAESFFDRWDTPDAPADIEYDLADEYEPDDDYSGRVGCIYKFTGYGEELFVDVFGTYRSHDGAYYQGWCFTKQVTKTVTVWG